MPACRCPAAAVNATDQHAAAVTAACIAGGKDMFDYTLRANATAAGFSDRWYTLYLHGSFAAVLVQA